MIQEEDYLKLRISKGDKDAYAIVFRKYYGKVYNFILSIVKDADTAKDMVQNVFMKLWDKRRMLTSIQSLDSYLFILSRNLTFDYFRSAYKKHRLPMEELDSILMSRISQDPSPKNEAGSELDYIRSLVCKMPERRRDIYIMSKFDGLSNQIIADYLGISKKTVENQLTLANSEIKKSLS